MATTKARARSTAAVARQSAARQTTTRTPTGRIERSGHLRWVAVADTHTSPMAQRDLREAWAAEIANDFDPDRFTPPVLSLRDGKFYIVDGQHRFHAMKLMGWEDQQLQCWVYEGLTEAEEADLFLYLNRQKAVSSFDKFRIAVAAGRADEVDVERTVRLQGLRVSQDRGGIKCVSALITVYRYGATTLGRTLRIIRDAYGDLGFRSEIVVGVGMLCHRYGSQFDDDRLIEKLTSVNGGMFGLLNAARATKRQIGRPLSHCVAAQAVVYLNAGKGGKKIPDWWSPE